MKKITFFIFFLSFFLNTSSYSQWNIGPHFLSKDKVFEPTRASVFEPRIGFLKNTNNNDLRLDIGASIDLISYFVRDKGKTNYSLGIDAFTFSNLRAESNFKFPVDAIDYFFGVNFNYKREFSNFLHFSSRLRVSHISSHLQDGHIYERTDTIFTPLTYSREFIDAAGVLDYYIKRTLIRNLLAINYLFSTIPGDFGTFALQYGFEVQHYFSEIISLYFSNDLRLTTVKDNTNLNENLEAGIRIGEYSSRGVNVFFSYYDGQDYKGQYYDRYLNYKAIGMSVDF